MLVKFNEYSDVRPGSTCIYTSEDECYYIVFLIDRPDVGKEFAEITTYDALPKVIKHMMNDVYGIKDNTE